MVGAAVISQPADITFEIVRFLRLHFVTFKVLKCVSVLYVFGGVLLFALLLQISSGLAMAIHYLPSSFDAFLRTARMARIFRFGWLVRSSHINGASLVFVVLYAHIFRGLYYRSYAYPRRAV